MSFSANDAFLESSKASLTEVVAQLEIARSRKIRDRMRTKKCYIRLGLNSSFVGTKSVASSGVLFVPSFIALSSESFERLSRIIGVFICMICYFRLVALIVG